jgi:hypothetical protein
MRCAPRSRNFLRPVAFRLPHNVIARSEAPKQSSWIATPRCARLAMTIVDEPPLRPPMTPTENLTSAFECLWETKVYLLRTIKDVDGALAPKLQAVLTEVATARDRVEALLIELQAKPPAAPVPPRE